MRGHNHLDRARRDRGQCPACDVLWQAQRELIAKGRRSAKAAAQLDVMMKMQADERARRSAVQLPRDEPG